MSAPKDPIMNQEREAVAWIISEAVLSASVEVPEDFSKRVLMRKTITKNATDAILALRSGGEGWRLVPVEPTREMLNGAIDVDASKLGDISPLGFRCSPQMLFEKCWAAMLAAAPSPSTQGEG